jgi:acetylornithine deacetylase/succinyl-diaminopimelate desuccinylase-like protein
MSASAIPASIHQPPAGLSQRPVELLQRLIRFDTTNPPGNEAGCIHFLNGVLQEAGIQTRLLALLPERPNLYARLPGRGDAPPLLLYGHVDVVSTENQLWQHPPFEGLITAGYVWGRGALDMKGGIAMMVSALLRAKADGLSLPGDVIFCAVCDEEHLGEYGAKFLVEQHAGLFQGVRYALGEFGGFTITLSGQRFYPIMIAEKQSCPIKVTLRGQGGHGSLPGHAGAMAKLGQVLQKLDRKRLPVHVTPAARLMVEKVAGALPGATGMILRQLTNPLLTDLVLDLLGERGHTFDPLFHNTVNPTILRASDKLNVIPSQVELGLDGRLLPGCTPDDLLRELRQMLGSQVELEVVLFQPGPSELDMGLFETLSDVLRQADPGGAPVPYLLSAVTDARHFSRLGIQTYGFLPMRLPDDFNFSATLHAADERIPVEALDFGAQVIYQVLQRFGP